MDRYWLLTWTCYGNWLPGDRRGFVGNIRDADGNQVNHNIPGTPYEVDHPGLEHWVRGQMKGDPISLSRADAEAVIAQFRETARVRKWSLEAASSMFNHSHLVVGVAGDPDPQQILETFKSWATRAVMKLRPLPPNGPFWTAKGSKRKLPDDSAVRAAVICVAKQQPNPLATWWAEHWQPVLDEYDATRRAVLRQEPGESD